MTELELLTQVKFTCLFEAVKLKQIPFASNAREYEGMDVVDIAKKLEQYLLNN